MSKISTHPCYWARKNLLRDLKEVIDFLRLRGRGNVCDFRVLKCNLGMVGSHCPEEKLDLARGGQGSISTRAGLIGSLRKSHILIGIFHGTANEVLRFPPCILSLGSCNLAGA